MTYTWEFEVQARIRELYCEQKKTLKDVMAVVNEEFPGMNGAKERTYQKYLKKWGITKGPSPRSRQQPSRTNSNHRNLRSDARRTGVPCLASLDAIFISENIPSNEGSITSSINPVDYTDQHSPVLVESTARILNTISLSHNSRSACLAFVGPTSNTACPEYSIGDGTTLRSQASIGESSRADNSMRTCEITGISGYGSSDITTDTNITSNPMSQSAVDQGDRPGLSPPAHKAVRAYLRIHSMSLTDYQKLYAQTGWKLAQNSEQETDESVYADIIPFEIFLQELSIDDDKVLLFCSFVGGTSNIALGVLSHFLNRPQEIVYSSIERLSSYGLVSQYEENISIEATIKNWLWIRNGLPRRLPLVQEMIVQVSKAIFLGRTPSKADWEFARISTPYFVELTNTILRFKDSGSSVWDNGTLEAAVVTADTARRVGENKTSRTILETVLPILKEIRGNGDPLTLDATNALSVVFINMKEWRAAERHLRTLVMIQEKQSFDITGFSYITQLSNWARALVQLGRDDDARHALDRIAELGKRIEDPIEILTHKVKLAETQRFCGDLNMAEGLLLRVLEDSRILLGDNHFRTMRILELLCYVYSDQKNYVQAELNSAKLVKLSQQALGPLQPDTVRRMKFHEKIKRRWGKQRE